MIVINVFIALLLAFVLLGLIYLIIIKPRKSKMESTSLIVPYAHRGLHGDGVPENSVLAFKKAVENGFGIELDVQLSKDGKVVVIHDYNLLRMTGIDKEVCQLTYDEISACYLENTEEKIPLLSRVLEVVDGKVPILIELKGEELSSSLCPKVAEVLEGYSGEYCIESFNPLLVKNAKKHIKNTYCGLLYTNVCRDKEKKSPLNILLTIMAFNFLAKPDFIAYNKKDRNSLPVWLTTKFYKTASFVWTVKGEEDFADAINRGETPIFEKQ